MQILGSKDESSEPLGRHLEFWVNFTRGTLAAGAIFALSGCFLFQPADAVDIVLPFDGTAARIEVWGNTWSEGRFEVVVQTPSGTVRDVLWEDWGPAQRASLYLTPEDWLVVLGGGGVARMIDLSAGGAPRVVPSREQLRQKSELWTYLGVVDRVIEKREARLRFFDPSTQPECIPLYGAGSSPYRIAFQDTGFC